MHFPSEVGLRDLQNSGSRRESRATRVAIIGGGFSGVATAIHLLRRAHPSGLELWVIEKSEKLGGGLAYGSERATDLLNVPAERMSVLESEPDHFSRWLRRSTGLYPREEVHFAPRAQYRRYLNETLQKAAASWPSTNRLHRCIGEVRELHRAVESGQWRLKLGDGSELLTDAVVLAVGWQGNRTIPQFTPEVQAAAGFVPQAWSRQALDGIDSSYRVLVVGTGLSMFDAVLDLQAKSHQGNIVALSRRGLLPQPHAPNGRHHLAPELIEWLTATETGRLSNKLRRLRGELQDIRRGGQNWRALIAAVRPLTPQIWQSWSAPEKHRFLRHYATLWDVHRHRSPPQSWSRVQAWIDIGRLEIVAARIESIRVTTSGFEVRWLPRSGIPTGARQETFQVIVNCLGPSSELQSSGQPLIQQLLTSRLITPDSSGLGIDCTSNLQVISGRGNPLPGLFVVGPLLRGKLGEATAVPELRHHASVAATQIAKKLCGQPAPSTRSSVTGSNFGTCRSGTG
jgi:uncharacterized NAD(P)/FAD-binding protein YdhS